MTRVQVDIKEFKRILDVISKVFIEATLRINTSKRILGFYTGTHDMIIYIEKEPVNIIESDKEIVSCNINVKSILNDFMFDNTSKSLILELSDTNIKLVNVNSNMFTNKEGKCIEVGQSLNLAVLMDNNEISTQDYYGEMKRRISFHIEDEESIKIRCIVSSDIFDKMLTISIKNREKMNIKITKSHLTFECVGAVNTSSLEVNLLDVIDSDINIDKRFNTESLNCIKAFKSISSTLMIKYVKINGVEMLLIYPTEGHLKLCIYLTLI